MFARRLWLIVLPAVLVGCRDGSVAAPEPDDAVLPAASMHGGAHHSSSDVLAFPMPGTLVDGWSNVTRNLSGATMTLHTSDVIPGNAYTMWVAIFNNPEECDGPCDEPDLFNPDVEADVVYVTGNVVGGQGTSTFSGRRAAGDNSKSLFAQLGLPAPGLIDPHAAELHLIVRDHGPAIPGQIPAQIHTFEGACTPESSFGLGAGPNTCADVQFSVHQP